MAKEPLSLSNQVELISGFATGLLAICMPALLGIGALTDFLPSIFISVLVSAGAYLHIVRRMIVGFVIVIIAGGLLGLVGAVGGAIVAAYGSLWSVGVVYLPGLTAFITLVAAIVTQLKRRV